MKKLVKSTLLALGILPFSLFSDDAVKINKKMQHYQITSEVVFKAPNVSATQAAFAPFGPKKLGVSFDLNTDFYFYNLVTEGVLNSLKDSDSETSLASKHGFYTLNPRTMNQIDQVPLRSHHTSNPLTDAIESIDAIDAMWARADEPVKKVSAKKPAAVKPIAVKSSVSPAPVVTLPRPMIVQQPTIEPTQPESIFAGSRLILELQQGTYTGGLGDAMMPFYGTLDNFFYANLIGSVFGPVYQTYSAGVGHRQVINNAIYGFYTYYDKQKSQANFYYDRVSGGVERLGMTWDVRANFYFYPNTPNNIADLGQQSAFIKANTNDIYYRHYYDVKDISSGADVEVGRTLGLDNLRGYLAAYSFGQYVNGGRARVTYNINPHWQINGMGQYDGGRGWLAMGGISYTLGRMEVTNTIIDRIREAVVRDLTVPEVTINSYQKTDLDTRKIYFASPTGTGGTATENNPTSLDNALSLAKPGDLIYLEGGDYSLTQKIQLQANQIFWGTGADLHTQGAKGFLLLPKSGVPSNLNADYIAKNQTTPNCLSYICAIYANNTASYGGFNLTNATPSTATNNFVGILISDASGLTFNEVNVSGFTNTPNKTGFGIRIDDGGTGNANPIFTNISANSNDIGLSIVSSGDVKIQGVQNTFNDNTNTGLYVNGSTAHTNLDIQHADFYRNKIGIYFYNTNYDMHITMSNVDASNNTAAGLWISTNANVVAHDVKAINNGLNNPDQANTYGIYMDDGTLDGTRFTLSGNGLQILVGNTGPIDATPQATLKDSSIIGGTLAQGTPSYAIFMSNIKASLTVINPVNVIGIVIINNGIAIINSQTLYRNFSREYNCDIKLGVGGDCSVIINQ